MCKVSTANQVVHYYNSISQPFITQLKSASTIIDCKITVIPLPEKTYTLDSNNQISPQINPVITSNSIKKISQENI